MKDRVLISKRCPMCNSLIDAKVVKCDDGEERYTDLQCSTTTCGFKVGQ